MKYVITILMLSTILLADSSNMDSFLQGDDACMVVLDQGGQTYIILNEERAAERFSPFSTHKIPHSLIALETGAVSDVKAPLTWDKKKYPVEDWWPEAWMGEHNLRSAIKVSLVPAYRQIASQLGEQTMQHYITQFQFGNEDISSAVDSYWLNGSLKISAMEQVNFLKRFYNGGLKLKEINTASVKDILIQEETDYYTISFKTGTGTVDSETGKALAWLVGYVERDGNVFFFAFNMEAKSFTEAVELRMRTAKNILSQLGLLE